SNPTVYLLSDGRYKVSYINFDRDPVEEFVAYWVGCGVETAGTADLKSYINGTEILLSDAEGCGQDGFDQAPAAVCAEELVCDKDCQEPSGWEFVCGSGVLCADEVIEAACCYDPCEREAYDCSECQDDNGSFPCPDECYEGSDSD
ncbi:hypothetical protein ACFLYO_10010, partial [Chloroflexota bacterium]